MTVQTRRQPAKCRRSWLLYPVFALMALSAVSCTYETIQRGSGGGAAPVKGDRLVDVGGYRLNIRCIGSGSPAVVLEPGLGESASAVARRIARQVARTTRVCVYDRAGHGRSDIAADADATRDLHVLLERAHVPGPYVLAGHSLGGMFVLGSRTAIRQRWGVSCSWTPCIRSRPTGVVTAGKGSQPGWTEHQKDLTTLSSHSFHRTVAGSTHQSLIDDPKDAVASIRTIRDVVLAVRDGKGA